MKLHALLTGGLAISCLAASPTPPPEIELSPIPPVLISPMAVSSSPHRPARLPSISMEAAVVRATSFLREHNKAASRYYICSVHWVSYSDKRDEDCWRIDFAANDSNPKPPMLMVLVFHNRVTFGAYV
jgi:hypothetical protein